MTDSLQCTTHVQKSVKHNALCNSCAKLTFCSPESIFTFLYAGCNVQNASKQFVSCTHLSFVNFALQKKTQKRKSKTVSSGDSKGTLSVTIQNQKLVHRTFLLTMTDTITSQNIELSSSITLYKNMLKISHRTRVWCRASTLKILTGTL
jgi:hypothetical protein